MVKKHENDTKLNIHMHFPESEEAVWTEWEKFKLEFERKFAHLIDLYDQALQAHKSITAQDSNANQN